MFYGSDMQLTVIHINTDTRLILKKKTFNLPVYFNVMFSMEKISEINTESRNVSFDNFF